MTNIEASPQAAAILFAESPPVVMPKKCAIKVARYETTEAVPRREHLQGTPLTIEGPARSMIEDAIEAVKAIVESLKIMEAGDLVPARYPPEALKEVIVNAVIHRDYNISDDILIRVLTTAWMSEVLVDCLVTSREKTFTTSGSRVIQRSSAS